MQGEARHERMMRRIIALLVAFSGLAETAAGRSYPVRFLLLLVLRHAETIARDYVADVMLVDGLWFDDGMECTSSPRDAALLAERFRLLAEELVGLLAPALRFGASRSTRDAIRSREARRARSCAGSPAPAGHARRFHATGPPASARRRQVRSPDPPDGPHPVVFARTASAGRRRTRAGEPRRTQGPGPLHRNPQNDAAVRLRAANDDGCPAPAGRPKRVGN
jgi:hypothetical protein